MISSHVLDTALGCPAPGLTIHLDVLEAEEVWRRLTSAITNRDGRVSNLADPSLFCERTCRLSFETGAYFASAARVTFFPRIDVLFSPAPGVTHYHIPLLLGPFSYSAYRGS